MKIEVGAGLQQRQYKHLKGIKEAIDMDSFIEFIIDTYNFLQDEKKSVIRDVFFAIDVILLLLT